MTDKKNALATARLCRETIPELEEFREYGAQTSVNVWALAKAANYLTRFAYTGSRADDYAEVVRKGVSICYNGVDATDASPNFDGLGVEV